jgi:3,4-dihydroxy 2-butanone 4-phosphate synthase/GTP cyclohydrolase II
MNNTAENIKKALADLTQGKMIILTDHPDRENEGDIVFPAEMINPEVTNFLIRNGSGIVCLTLTADKIKQLGLPMMVPFDQNNSQRNTPFTVTIEAKAGITTGVSAADRATTILAAINNQELVSPGHVFPLQAKEGGVFERDGHTEGSVDLMKLAGLKPAAVICELMNSDGTMMHGTQINKFAEQHDMTIISIAEIIQYRLLTENLIAAEVTTDLVLQNGKFAMTVFKEKLNSAEHIILANNPEKSAQPILVRIHSACITGDLFGSMQCDCQAQLNYSLKQIANEGGMLFYLNQEGRGIGLFNKIKAYNLQAQGLDTVEANLALNLPIDARQYYMVAHMLRNKNIKKIRLMTNNPKKIAELQQLGIEICATEPMPIFSNSCNEKYLATKKNKLNHTIGKL